MAEHGNGHEQGHGHGSVATYILVALVLGVITYVEFAIVEYDLAWLSDSFVLWTLIILSVGKFLLVVMFFMHLKGDDPTYSFFFSSGMAIALGIFVATTFMFVMPASFSFLRGQFTPPTEPAHDEEHAGVSEEITALIESDGYSRELSERFRAARPKDQSLRLTPPGAAAAEFTLLAGQALEDTAAPDEDQAEAGEAAADGADGADQAAEGWDEALGEQVFSQNCAACHQGEGQGVPGAFPPLAGHLPEVVSVEGGREYLVDVLLFGLQGEISVQGQTYAGMMPSWSQLDDEELAAVLNHSLHAWGNAEELPEDFTPVGADAFAERRGAGLTPQEVLEERRALDLP